jgi:hypothetical protein
MARTAVVAGTATAVSNRVSRRQYNRWSAQEPQYYEEPPQQQQQQYYQPAPAAAPGPSAEEDRIARLKDLADLKSQGILTEQEFAAEKARILGT